MLRLRHDGLYMDWKSMENTISNQRINFETKQFLNQMVV